MNYRIGDELTPNYAYYRENTKQILVPGERYKVKHVTPVECLLTDPLGYDFVLSREHMDVIFGMVTSDRFDYAMGIV